MERAGQEPRVRLLSYAYPLQFCLTLNVHYLKHIFFYHSELIVYGSYHILNFVYSISRNSVVQPLSQSNKYLHVHYMVSKR